MSKKEVRWVTIQVPLLTSEEGGEYTPTGRVHLDVRLLRDTGEALLDVHRALDHLGQRLENGNRVRRANRADAVRWLLEQIVSPPVPPNTQASDPSPTPTVKWEAVNPPEVNPPELKDAA